jgi:hypothetical protein
MKQTVAYLNLHNIASFCLDKFWIEEKEYDFVLSSSELYIIITISKYGIFDRDELINSLLMHIRCW